MRKKGFTLIELLVVIAIIAILAGMLLPALSKAKNHVRTVSCASNMKSIGLMIQMYGNDFSYVLPMKMDHAVHREKFFDALLNREYGMGVDFQNLAAVEKSVFCCPGELHPNFGNWYYGVNGLLCGDETSTGSTYTAIKKVSLVIHPSTAFVMGDAWTTSDAGPSITNRKKLAFRHNDGEARAYPVNVNTDPVETSRKTNLYYFDHHVAPETVADVRGKTVSQEAKAWSGNNYFQNQFTSGFTMVTR